FNGRVGAKNFSVFRRYLGGALMRRRDADDPCLSPAPGLGHWEKQDARPCPSCARVESQVSELLSSAFTFRCVRMDDPTERNNFEEWLIATVAACPVCRASDDWLGHHAYPPTVRGSGLWNVQYVRGPLIADQQLRRFQELVRMTLTSTGSAKDIDLSR